ncbi:MAG: hypothetical protein V7647_3496 [Acidobacteriota bacterium]|jgi:hypothetical protein
MGPSSPLGVAVKRIRPEGITCHVQGATCNAQRVTCLVLLLAALGLVPKPAWAQARYALIVSGATGGPEYAAQYSGWCRDLTRILIENDGFDPAALTVLSETADPATAATAANIRRVLDRLDRMMTRDDLLLVVLIGHGTFDGLDAKFNLVGPDLDASEWAALLRPIPGRLVVVNTTAASFPFLERLAARRRIVITATDSVAQRFDTVFPGYFVSALADDGADLDKNARISIWEAFAAASAAVRRHYQQRGQLSTERALLDDNGDGVGADVVDQREDGSYASRTYLDEARPGAAATDEVLLRLLHRKAVITAEVEDLRIRKAFLSPGDYAREFERLMIELAGVSHDIRARVGS